MFRIVIISPPGNAHSGVFTDIAEALFHALRELGHPVELVWNRVAADRVNILFGAILLNPTQVDRLPPGTIIYNLEQIEQDSKWLNGALPACVRRFEVWDYSPRNIDRFAALGFDTARMHLVPIGHAAPLERIAPVAVEDIDVLFYGSTNPRRLAILNALKARQLNVVHVFGVYGKERDALIARAKVVLNMHFFEAKVFEVVRVSYLLANAKAVVAECDPGTILYDGLEQAVRTARHDELVDACVALVADAGERRALAQRGLLWMRAHPFANAVAPMAERWRSFRPPEPAAPPRQVRLADDPIPPPDWVIAGDGPDADLPWRPEEPLPMAIAPNGRRFRPLPLPPGSLHALDIGEWPVRVADWPALMRQAAVWLADGGRLLLNVPHAGSANAWDDPRTRRVLTLGALQQFTDAHVRWGWREEALVVAGHQVTLSPQGIALQQQGCRQDEILATPGAVARVSFTLIKRRHRALPPSATV